MRLRRIIYDRIPKPLRPKWLVWKKLCQICGDPRKAEIAIFSQAIRRMETKKDDK